MSTFFPVVMVAAVTTLVIGCAVQPRSAFLKDLSADAPAADLKPDLMLFGQFVGAWDLDIRFFDEAGQETFHGPGRWTFAWVLDGLAIQDVITYGPVDASGGGTCGPRRTGTTLRHFNRELGTWRIVFLGATSGVLVVLTGGRAQSGIILEGSEAPGVMNRWSFSEITGDSFHWRGEISHNRGASWRLEQERRARRSRYGEKKRTGQMGGPRWLGGGGGNRSEVARAATEVTRTAFPSAK